MVDRRPRLTWREVFTSLAASVAEVVKAELTLIKIDAGRGAKRLAFAAAAVVVLLFLLFWAIGIVYASSILALQWMSAEWWGGQIGPFEATAWVTGLFLLVFFAAGLTAYVFGKGALTNVKLAIDRFDDHMSWWRDHMFVDEIPQPSREVNRDERT